MILSTNTEFVYYNPNDKSFHYALDTDNLYTLNNQGYNIYIILNDFEKTRSNKDLFGLNYIGVDIDMQNSSVKTPYNHNIDDILNKCKKELGFLPFKINGTYKGYHLYFKLDEKLYTLQGNYYISLYKKVNTILGGDPQMKDTTGILKVEGFKDNKDGRDSYIINTLYLNKENILKKRVIEKLMGVDIILDEKRIELLKQKRAKTERNSVMIESIDALDFVNSINSNSDIFGVNISVSGGSIDETDGLKVYNDGERNVFKDFSGKNRYGNSRFLYNYVVKDLMGIEDLFDSKDEKVISIKNRIIGWLSKEFGIKYNKGLGEKPIYNTFIHTNITKNMLVIDEDYKKVDIQQEILNGFNDLITTVGKKGELIKLIIGLNNYLFKNNLDGNKTVTIKEKELLKEIGYSDKNENIQNLRKNVILLGYLRKETIVEEGKLKGYKKNFQLYNVEIFKKDNVPVIYNIKFNVVPQKSIWINDKVLLEVKKPNHFYLYTKIKTEIDSFGKCNLSIKNSLEDLDLSEKRGLIRILDKFKDEGYIKSYKEGVSTIEIF